MKRLLVLGTIAVFGATLAAYQAPAQPAIVGTAAQLDVVKLKDNFFVITSSSPTPRETFSGGNVSVLITDNGVTLVDTKLANWGQALLDKLKTITPKPVTMIVNTHTHGDHTGNDDKFGKVEIVAHENTKANMAKMPAFAGEKAQFLPAKTFSDKLTIGKGASQIDLHYFGRAHTNGDAVLIFPALRIAAMGDMFAWKDAPRCDAANGGSCVEYPKTVAGAAAALKNIDTVIPGHSPMMKVSDVQEYAKFLADMVSSAQASKKAGKTVDEATAAFSVAKYPGYKAENVKAAIQVIYDETK
ncbi:MAG TPA: MBL fold metallo-hydrolase [Vicinamibacterales bacterium]|nr:MBL fold metallo-hydrolase [Vicinamibacterales bacterium]